MIKYNKKFLNPNNLQEADLILIENEKLPFDYILENKRLLEHQEFEFVYVSAKTEGNTYTKEEAITLIERGITANAKPLKDAIMLKNLKKAFELYVLNPAPLNKKTLREIHKILTEGLLDTYEQGTFRTEPVSITGTDYIPPSYGKEFIEIEVDYILENANNIQNPIKKAIYLHNNIAYLQPFSDGNKRTARILQSMEMAKKNIMPLIMKEEFISAYRKGILTYYETGKYYEYLKFFKEAYKKQTEYLKVFFDYNIQKKIKLKT